MIGNYAGWAVSIVLAVLLAIAVHSAEPVGTPEIEEVCVETQLEYRYAYMETGYPAFTEDDLDEDMVLTKDNYTHVDGSVWLTINGSQVDVKHPKIRYRAHEVCMEKENRTVEGGPR